MKAIQLWRDDNGLSENEERKSRTKKDNPDKKAIIEVMFNALATANIEISDLKVTNDEKYIDFCLKNSHYTISLTQHREKMAGNSKNSLQNEAKNEERGVNFMVFSKKNRIVVNDNEIDKISYVIALLDDINEELNVHNRTLAVNDLEHLEGLDFVTSVLRELRMGILRGV